MPDFWGVVLKKARASDFADFAKIYGLGFTHVRAGIKPAPTVGHDLFRNQPVGATLVVARVGGYFSTTRRNSLNNLFCGNAQAKSPLLETEKTIGRVGYSKSDTHKLVGIAHPTRLEVIYG